MTQPGAKTLDLIDWRLFAAGGFEIIYAGAQASDRILVGDASGLLMEVQPERIVFGRDLVPDLIGARDGGEVPWIVEGGRLDLELADEPSSADIAWRATAGPQDATVTFRDAFAAEGPALRPGVGYRLDLHAGGVEGGEVEALVLDSAGGTLQRLGPGSQPGLEAEGGGGGRAWRFVAPASGASVLIAVQLPAGTSVRLGRPSLTQDGPDACAPVRLSRRGLARLRATRTPGEVVRLRGPIPPELFVDGTSILHLSVRRADGAGDRLDLADLPFRRRPTLELLKKGIERASLVRLVGRLHEPAQRYLRLQLVIDGVAGPIQTVKAAANGKFDARLPIPTAWLDGEPHRIEARLAESQAVLFGETAPCAAFHTRWPVLQLWAQPPLSPETSPAARRHLAALRTWSQRAAQGRALPDVVALHDELLAGVRRRPVYPPLDFPVVEAPAVSVIVPAHNKFEVTYAGLSALRFAPTETSFEVVLVDDGSSDETARIEATVTGLNLVRHAEGQGFVAACNDGAARARGRFLCFLNNDTEVTAGWLDALLRPFAEDSETGLTGAKLIYPDGRLQEAGGIVWGTGDPWNAGRGGDADAPQWSYRRQVDYLSGAAILIPRALWTEVGGFGQEWAPAYFEDTDLAMKVTASGRRVIYVPDCEVYHFEGQTAGVDKSQGAKLHQELNRPKFKAKWAELFKDHGPVVGERPDLEKDRGVRRRALVLVRDLDFDTALVAAATRLRSQGTKVTLAPLDGRWRSTAEAWGRLGVEVLFAPYLDLTTLEALADDLDEVIVAGDIDVEPLRQRLDRRNPGLSWSALDALTG